MHATRRACAIGTTPAVDAVLERRPNIAGARKLRRVIEGDVHVTLSALERRFLQLLDAEGLPAPGHQPARRRPAGGLPLA